MQRYPPQDGTIYDQVNFGTLNYKNPSGEIFEQAGHIFYDVLPWAPYGSNYTNTFAQKGLELQSLRDNADAQQKHDELEKEIKGGSQ